MSLMFLDSFPWYMSPSRDFMLYKRDTLELLPSIPDNSVDLIFADPPYFLSNGGTTCQSGKRVEVHKGEWDKSQGADENHAFNRRWLEECQRILSPDGSIFVSGTHHVIFSIGFAMQQLDMKILNDIAWYKVNPPPNLACRYFTHATETIIWASKNQTSRHFFDYQAMKEENGGKQMQSLWSITPPKKSEKRFGRHPTQKPISLLLRILAAASREGDLVLDPFMGSGTTGVAAAITGRRFIGVELNEEYLDLARQRYEFRDEEQEQKLDKTFKRQKTMAAKTITSEARKPRKRRPSTSDLFSPEE